MSGSVSYCQIGFSLHGAWAGLQLNTLNIIPISKPTIFPFLCVVTSSPRLIFLFFFPELISRNGRYRFEILHINCSWFIYDYKSNETCEKETKKIKRTFLVVQWLRIHLPVQGTSSVPGLRRFYMLRSNKTWVLQLLSLCSRARVPQLLKPACPRACAPREGKPLHGAALTPQRRVAPVRHN